MKVSRFLGNGLQFEAEADTQIKLFEALAEIDKKYAEVFGERACGICGSENIYFQVRTVEKEEVDEKTKKVKKKSYTYYEMRCRDCGATLSFGQHQEGDTLFPKRKLEDGTWDNKHRGWKKYVKKTVEGDEAKPSKEKLADPETPF